MEEIEISLKSIQKTGKQISGNLKLLLLIKGQLEVSVCDKVYQMKPNQILLIDRNQPHSLRGSHQNVVLKLELCVNFLEREGADFLEYGYSCYSGEESEDKKTAYYELRQNMMQQLITYVDKKQGYRLEQKKILYSIISCLYKYFRQEKFILPQRCNETRIVFEAQHYINKNYD